MAHYNIVLLTYLLPYSLTYISIPYCSLITASLRSVGWLFPSAGIDCISPRGSNWVVSGRSITAARTHRQAAEINPTQSQSARIYSTEHLSGWQCAAEYDIIHQSTLLPGTLISRRFCPGLKIKKHKCHTLYNSPLSKETSLQNLQWQCYRLHQLPRRMAHCAVCNSAQELLELWCEHYQELLNHESATTCRELDSAAAAAATPDSDTPDNAPSLEEVCMAIDKLHRTGSGSR